MTRVSTVSTPEGSGFSRFMASKGGRAVRVALGATIVGSGLTVVGGGAGLAMAAFGLVPMAAGVFSLCPVAPAA